MGNKSSQLESSATSSSPHTPKSARASRAQPSSSSARKHSAHVKSPRVSGAVDSSRKVDLSTILTSYQRQMIVKHWSHTSKTGSNHIGTKIMLRLLEMCPAVRPVLGLELVVSSQLPMCAKFQDHSKGILKTIDLLIGKLNNPELILPEIRQAGARHVQYQLKGFRLSFWDVFAQAAIECLCEGEGSLKSNKETMRAWRVLIFFMIDEMRSGYSEELKGQRSTGAVCDRKVSTPLF